MFYNFNDYWGSFASLSVILATNNWNDYSDFFASFTGNNFVSRLYLSIFFFLITLVMVNIIISFVLEIYASIEGTVRDERKKLEHVKYLMKKTNTTIDLLDLITSTFGEDIAKNDKSVRQSR